MYSWCLQWASLGNDGGNDVGGGDAVVVGGGVCVRVSMHVYAGMCLSVVYLLL